MCVFKVCGGLICSFFNRFSNLPVSIADGDPRTLDDISGGRGILSAMGVSGIGVGSERADEIAARSASERTLTMGDCHSPSAALIQARPLAP